MANVKKFSANNITNIGLFIICKNSTNVNPIEIKLAKKYVLREIAVHLLQLIKYIDWRIIQIWLSM